MYSAEAEARNPLQVALARKLDEGADSVNNEGAKYCGIRPLRLKSASKSNVAPLLGAKAPFNFRTSPVYEYIPYGRMNTVRSLSWWLSWVGCYPFGGEFWELHSVA
jgi:hypothetical protein